MEIKLLQCTSKRWKNKGTLKGGVIGTLMSNYGLENFFIKNKYKFY